MLQNRQNRSQTNPIHNRYQNTTTTILYNLASYLSTLFSRFSLLVAPSGKKGLPVPQKAFCVPKAGLEPA